MNQPTDSLVIKGDYASGTWFDVDNNRIGRITLSIDLLGDRTLVVVKENREMGYSSIKTFVADSSWSELHERAQKIICRWRNEGYMRMDENAASTKVENQRLS